MAKAMSLKSSSETVTETKTVVIVAAKVVDPMSHTFTRREFSALDDAKVQANINKLYAAGKNARIIAHITACGILLHYVETGDYTKLIALRDAIGAAMSKSLSARFVEWVVKYSSLKWRPDEGTGKDKKPGGFYHVKNSDKVFHLEDTSKPDDKGGAVVIKGAINKPFYSFDRETDAKPHAYDFQTAMADFVKRLHAELALKERATAAGNTDVEVKLTPEQVEAVDKFAVQFGVLVQKPATATAPATVQ